jgi:hypothetical protein
LCICQSQVVLQGLAADANLDIPLRSLSHGPQVGDDAGLGEVLVADAVAVQGVRPAFSDACASLILDLRIGSASTMHATGRRSA